MTRFAISLLPAFFIAAGVSLWAGEADAKKDEARKLVTELGADSYSVRHRAQLELMKLGRPAVDALQDATLSEDAEVRTKATSMLVELRGRGFLGIEMREVGEDGDDTPVEEAESTKPVVHIVNVPQSPKEKPFPAEAAGLKSGDMVVSVNGNRVLGLKDLQREVIVAGPARVVLVEIMREQALMRVPVVLTRRGDDAPVVDLESDEAPAAVDPNKPAPVPVVEKK